MNGMLKYLSQTLNRYYGAVVQQPMPWKVIDKLVTLEEAEEKRPLKDKGGAPHDAGERLRSGPAGEQKPASPRR
jgi:hypothetical protein